MVWDSARREQQFQEALVSRDITATVGEGQTPVTLSSGEDDRLGEELRVLLAHSMRNGHHQLPWPGGVTRLDPSGEERLGRGVLVG